MSDRKHSLRANVLIICAVIAVLVFVAGIAFIIWGVIWSGGQKEFRRELAESIEASSLGGATAVGTDGAESKPEFTALNSMLIQFTNSEYYVSRGSPEEGAETISLSFADGAELTLTLMGDEGLRAEFLSSEGNSYKYDLDPPGLTPQGMFTRLEQTLGLA